MSGNTVLSILGSGDRMAADKMNTRNASADHSAYTEEVIRRYMPLVKSSAAKFETELVSKEDLESEGCLAVLNALEHYDANKCGELSAYLSVCVNNRMISVLRKSDKTIRFDHVTEDTARDNTTPETIFLARELGSEIEKQLSPMEYSIFVCCLNELSYSETASRLNITPKAVDNAVQRIRRKLKNIYGKEFNI